MTKIGGETQTKDGKKHKEYSIESVKKTRIVTYMYDGKIQELPIEYLEKMYITNYKGEIKDRKILKWVPFISTFEGVAVRITGLLIIILGAIIYAGAFYVFFEYVDKSKLITGFLLVILGSGAGLSIFLAGMNLIYDVAYVKTTKCKICHKNFAYEEREEPDIKEVSTENSYIVTIIRYWKCKYCENIDSTESPENIKSHKEKKEKPKEIKCEKCGKTGTSSECRDPDVKEESFPMSGVTTTTIRYYKCKYCGSLNITEERVEPTSGL